MGIGSVGLEAERVKNSYGREEYIKKGSRIVMRLKRFSEACERSLQVGLIVQPLMYGYETLVFMGTCRSIKINGDEQYTLYSMK